MTLTDRDRKIAMVLVPLVLTVGYWFFVLGPKRDEAAKLGAKLSEAAGKRDAANAQVGQLEGSKNSYAKDYETVVRLGKAIPATLDMPSLLVQLESAAKGTGRPKGFPPGANFARSAVNLETGSAFATGHPSQSSRTRRWPSGHQPIVFSYHMGWSSAKMTSVRQ